MVTGHGRPKRVAANLFETVAVASFRNPDAGMEIKSLPARVTDGWCRRRRGEEAGSAERVTRRRRTAAAPGRRAGAPPRRERSRRARARRCREPRRSGRAECTQRPARQWAPARRSTKAKPTGKTGVVVRTWWQKSTPWFCTTDAGLADGLPQEPPSTIANGHCAEAASPDGRSRRAKARASWTPPRHEVIEWPSMANPCRDGIPTCGHATSKGGATP